MSQYKYPLTPKKLHSNQFHTPSPLAQPTAHFSSRVQVSQNHINFQKTLPKAASTPATAQKPSILRQKRSKPTQGLDQPVNISPRPAFNQLFNSPPPPSAIKSFDFAAAVRPEESRPPYSYAKIIEMAIASSPRRRLTLKDIYTWIERNFAYFKTAKPGWKNSIRHNLSLHNIFVKQNDEKNSTWSLHPGLAQKSGPTATESMQPPIFKTAATSRPVLGDITNKIHPITTFQRNHQNDVLTPIKHYPSGHNGTPRPVPKPSQYVLYPVTLAEPPLSSPSYTSTPKNVHTSKKRNLFKLPLHPSQSTPIRAPKQPKWEVYEDSGNASTSVSSVTRSPPTMVCRSFVGAATRSRKAKVELLNDSFESALLETSGSDTSGSSNNTSPSKDGCEDEGLRLLSSPKNEFTAAPLTLPTPAFSTYSDTINQHFDPLYPDIMQADIHNCTMDGEINRAIFENDNEISRILDSNDMSILNCEDIEKILS